MDLLKIVDPWNVLENVPGIDRWNVLENASIRSRDRASIQTSRHGRENEERSSLHKQLIFVAFGVPYYVSKLRKQTSLATRPKIESLGVQSVVVS